MHRTYQAVDLVRSYLDAREFRAAHSDLATYHGDRYRALARAFTTDLDAYAAGVLQRDQGTDALFQDANANTAALALFAAAVRQYELTTTPFDGLMEAPRTLAELIHFHAPTLQTLAESTREALVLLMRDLLVELAPHVTHLRCSSHELSTFGFDDRREQPDPLDYW